MPGWQVILIASALVCAVSGALAALLVFAERFLVRYGRCLIDINRGHKRLTAQGGRTLLATLMEEGIFVPSACGGRGTCALCKLKVLQGGGPLAPTEVPLLKPDEIRDRVRISCQVKVRNDIAIEVPEELFSIRSYRGVVERILDLTHDIKELRIRLVEPESIRFTPGQYIQLVAPAYEGSPEPVYRAYSMSRPPSDDRAVETIIRLVPDGICTTWVFRHLKEGDEVEFNGPYGQFRLSTTPREMIWIAGGSGMAPFWSILRHMQEKNVRRKTMFFFGAVRRNDIFFLDEMRRKEKELEWFRFVPALSAPAEGGQWDGEHGLITEAVDRLAGDAADKEAYLCGSPGMIDAAIKVLKAKGMTDDRIFYDKFA